MKAAINAARHEAPCDLARMPKEKFTRVLGDALGLGFVLFGIVESPVAAVGRDQVIFFWFPALCGGAR